MPPAHAHVSLNTNSGRALSRASNVVSVPGVPLAIAQPGFSMNLLFGSGWMHRCCLFLTLLILQSDLSLDEPLPIELDRLRMQRLGLAVRRRALFGVQVTSPPWGVGSRRAKEIDR